jgi:hypothetical protein
MYSVGVWITYLRFILEKKNYVDALNLAQNILTIKANKSMARG